MQTNPSFKQGARGYLVQDVQEFLDLKRDGDFGPRTEAAVKDYQAEKGLPATGHVDAATFSAMGMPFPGEFLRCLCLTDAFEGTGFGGINDTDIDGAGVTLGIIGFTTQSGEVQKVIRTYLTDCPDAIAAIPEGRRRDQLHKLISTVSKQPLWDFFFYGSDGRVDQDIKNALKLWARDPKFRAVQLEMTIERFWIPAINKADELGFASMAGRGLMFDTWVQNGGWRGDHMREFRRNSSGKKSETELLLAAATAVADCANARWRSDVLTRKKVFALGKGKVHGHNFTLDAQAFE